MRSGTFPLFLAENAILVGDVILGEDVSVWFGAVIRADKDTISLGNRSNIQDNAVVHTSTGYPVSIGDDVSVGHGAILHGCTIADRVLVGMGAIVMNGACVGENSIIGAGAVITERSEIPSGSVVLGIPGKVVRQTTEVHCEQIVKNAINYIELARSYRT